MYACDFETRNDMENATVWHWGYSEIGNPENFHWGIHLDDFMEWLISKHRTKIYFHNLAHDGESIVIWLENNGWEWVEDTKYIVKEKQYTTLIKENIWYSVTIGTVPKNKRMQKVDILDSYKKLPFKLEVVARDFGLPISKGEIDYDKHRPIGYNPTEKEIEYLELDCKILAMALDIQFKQGLDRITIGSDCLKEYKLSISKDGTMKSGNKEFRKLFPILSKDLDDFVRKSYKGGFTYVNEGVANKVFGEGIGLDYNSMYPNKMDKELLPYGVPIYYKGKYKENKTYPLYVQHITVSFDIKKDHIPTVQFKKPSYLEFKKNEYVRSTNGCEYDLFLTNIDLQLLKDHYDIHYIQYHSGVMFRAKRGMYSKYIQKFTKQKIENNENLALRTIAKLLLNNLYGKTGTDLDLTKRKPTIVDGKLKLINGKKELGEPVYTATASFVTSYARDDIIRTSQSCYDRYLYSDTDSIYLTGKEIPVHLLPRIHKTELGMLDLETEFTRFKALFQKCYMYEILDKEGNKKLTIKGAGMTDKVKEKITNFDMFKLGLFLEGVSNKKRHGKGGAVIHKGDFTLRIRHIG